MSYYLKLTGSFVSSVATVVGAPFLTDVESALRLGTVVVGFTSAITFFVWAILDRRAKKRRGE